MTPALFDRADYPTLDDSIYLNQASLGLVGRPAVDAMHRFLDDVGRHGNLHMSDDDEAAFFTRLRTRAARLFHTDDQRIAILSSASELLGQVPYLLPAGKGATVVAMPTDFPAITRPWLAAAEEGRCRLRFVDDDPTSDPTDDLIAAIDEQTALVTVGSVQYSTGTRIDVPRLRAATAAAGARLVVDATQSAGALDTDTEPWGADVVVSSGYKWLGGHGGVAIAAVAPSTLERTPPFPGWMGAPDPFQFDATHLRLADDARRFTQSTMSYVSLIGLTAALDQLLDLNPAGVEAHSARLARALIEAVEPCGWRPFRPLGDPAATPHIVALGHPTHDAAGVVSDLRQAGIVCSSRGERIRVSLAPYNSEQDVAALAAALP